jgi:hypothetical protein
MSIFKTLGSKLKRVISIKNLTNVATGQFTAIGADLVRVATTKSPAEIKKGLASTEQVAPNFAIPKEVNTILDSKGAQFKTAVSTALAQNPTVQNVSDMFTKTYIQSMWLKYKNWIIGLIATLVMVFIGWKIFKKPAVKRGRTRR